MDKMIFFLKILTWIFGVASLIFAVLSMYFNSIYPGSIEEIIDRSRGRRTHYPTEKWVLILIICIVFIVAFW
jgi:hypothetical protein